MVGRVWKVSSCWSVSAGLMKHDLGNRICKRIDGEEVEIGSPSREPIIAAFHIQFI